MSNSNAEVVEEQKKAHEVKETLRIAMIERKPLTTIKRQLKRHYFN